MYRLESDLIEAILKPPTISRQPVFAARTPAASGKRLIISARQFTYQQFCDILRPNIPALAEWTTLGDPGDDAADIDAYGLNNTLVVELLGLRFRQVEETVVDLGQQLLEIERQEKGD